MKYTMLFGGKGFLESSAMFSDYIISNKESYFEIGFTDSDFKEVFDILEAVHKKYSAEMPESFEINGEDGKIYLLSENEICITDRKAEPKKERIKASLFHIYESVKNAEYKRNKKYFDSLLSASDRTKTIKNFSFSKFKKYKFICKEENTAFCYRLKKSRNENAPLVVFFHGSGCIGRDNFKQYFEAFYDSVREPLEKFDCSVLLPQLPYRFGWNDSQHARAVKLLSEFVVDEVKADKKRIYVIGTSMGGYNTWQSAYLFPDYYACAVPVMGWLFPPDAEDEIDFERMKNLPIWIAHSADDENVRITADDKCYDELSRISDKVKYTRWENYGHKMAGKFYKSENWAEWMFSQKKE